MKRGMFLLVFFVAAMFAVTNTIQVYPGDCIIQEDLDDLGWHGELIVENVWETPIYMDVDLILRNGNSMMVDENIYMIKDTLGLTLNVISMIGDGSTLTGGKYSNPSGVGSGIYVDGIMNEISSVGVDGAVTGVYVNVGSQVDIEACNIDNTEIAMDLRHETSVDIRWTTIENSSQYAVLIHDNCDVYMQENIIHDSRVSVHGGRHSSVTIVDCEFDGEAYPFRGLDFDNTDYVHIQNSRISGDSVGIYAQYVDSLYVVNTIVEDVVLMEFESKEMVVLYTIIFSGEFKRRFIHHSLQVYMFSHITTLVYMKTKLGILRHLRQLQLMEILISPMKLTIISKALLCVMVLVSVE